MMFASKTPSLRIDQSDLKCKNGCDYYGNQQWQGYCSKCHRELMQKQRRAEKASTASSTLPKPDQKKPKQGLKLTTHSSFSRFEEKRLKQSETLKKANILKFSVFKKSNTEDHDHQAEKRPPEFKIPSQVNENMKVDFRIRFSNLTPLIDRDARAFVHSFIGDVIKCANVMTVDELSERVQRQYQRFMKHMDTSPHFVNVDSDTKERLMDFVEKHAMTYLHDLPSVVFSPLGTEDERLDRLLSERVQQLGWVCAARLDCRLARDAPRCRQLLYKAISELLGMDSAVSPGGKLCRVRRCCRVLLALAPPPASADDLLPALIFTVLKANPPRLVSNINFVTRFCNAQRLMTGEGGYYFTNLCCAVSFIENLNAESLNMDQKEFDCYMAMPASIGGSAWAAALSLCGVQREAEEQNELMTKLMAEADQLNERAEQFAANAINFEEQIKKKVQDVLAKTPLEIKPRRELPRVGKLRQLSSTPLVSLASTEEPPPRPHSPPPRPHSPPPRPHSPPPRPHSPPPRPHSPPPRPHSPPPRAHSPSPRAHSPPPRPHSPPPAELRTHSPHEEPKEPKLNILGFEVIERDSPSKSPQPAEPAWGLKRASSLELLTPSPLGFTPFDSRSIDELLTPDDFGAEHLAPGLGNVNYDIDLSDLSADNSLAEDAPKPPRDPFSPDPIKKEFDPFAPQTSRDQYSKVLEKFDEFSLLDPSTDKQSDPFEVVHRDPFSPLQAKGPTPNDPFSPLQNQSGPAAGDPFSVNTHESSILDDSESPTAACLLPSPLLPQNTGKSA